jgi:hypothetical protein
MLKGALARNEEVLPNSQKHPIAIGYWKDQDQPSFWVCCHGSARPRGPAGFAGLRRSARNIH